MGEARDLPEWAERLHAALSASGCTPDEMMSRLLLWPGDEDDWLTPALRGEVKPTVDDLAPFAALCDVPLALLLFGRTDVEADAALDGM